MKKAIRLMVMGLALISVSCTPAQKTLITDRNLPTLKGRWEGWTDFGIGQARPVLTWMEIVNDSVPLQGKITLNQLPEAVALVIPADAKTADNSLIIEFKNGTISNQGTIVARSGQNFIELTYFGGAKPKLEGWFYYWALKGTLSVTKK